MLLTQALVVSNGGRCGAAGAQKHVRSEQRIRSDTPDGRDGVRFRWVRRTHGGVRVKRLSLRTASFLHRR